MLPLWSPGQPYGQFLGCQTVDFCTETSASFVLVNHKRKKKVPPQGPGQGLPNIPPLIDFQSFKMELSGCERSIAQR